MNPTERRYDIDWLRVIAIGLLLLYHIAIIFQPWAMFIGFVRSDELWEDLWKPMTLLNIWRIPLLFFVSGMGCYFALKKRSAGQLIGERTRRIYASFCFWRSGHYSFTYVFVPGVLRSAAGVLPAHGTSLVFRKHLCLCRSTSALIFAIEAF